MINKKKNTKKISLTKKQMECEIGAMLVTVWIDLKVINKLKDATDRTSSKYKVLINAILKKYTDNYLKRYIK